jgi:EamA domain-containing membrane protein RarD
MNRLLIIHSTFASHEKGALRDENHIGNKFFFQSGHDKGIFKTAASRMSIEGNSYSNPKLNSGRLLILVTAVLWSLAGVFIKSLELHPLAIVFYRSLFASLFFVFFMRKKNWTVNLPLFVSVLSYTAAISSFVSANKLTSAANAIVLQYTAPIFVFVFARILFHEAISKLNLMASRIFAASR